MPIAKNQLQMLVNKNFGLKTVAANMQFATILLRVIDGSFMGHELILQGLALNDDCLAILDYVLRLNPGISANILKLHLHIDQGFPVSMPSFVALKNLESLHISGEGCVAHFDPLNFSKLKEFSWYAPTTYISQFPDLRECENLEHLDIRCGGIRYPNDFAVPGLTNKQELDFASFKTILPRLEQFKLQLYDAVSHQIPRGSSPAPLPM